MYDPHEMHVHISLFFQVKILKRMNNGVGVSRYRLQDTPHKVHILHTRASKLSLACRNVTRFGAAVRMRD